MKSCWVYTLVKARTISSALLLWGLSLGLQAQQQLEWGDQGNGTYKNPVLNADYSDPDVIRVDDTYYMVASDFHFIGMQVLESKDMVNWQTASQVYHHFPLPGWDENAHYGGGSWAPAIRYHEGRFFIYFCTPDEGLFMATASDAHGPWSPLHCVKAVEKWEDPCPFWDDNGQAYLGRSQYGAGPIIIHRMSADGRQLLDDGVTVYTGPVAEGTKIMKRDGYYYLIIPEGGVCCGWQTVLRSRNIYGPYEKRVVLEQGSTLVNGPHQGALVEGLTMHTSEDQTSEKDWWFFHFQETHPAGRVVHLQPARWKDGWPLMGVDIDGNGIGEPVAVWPSPGNSSTSSLSSHSRLPSHSSLANPSDDFSDGQLYWVGDQQRALPLQWQWNHNPVDSAWSLTERHGWLTLHALPSPTLKQSRNMLTQKTLGYKSQATTRLDCSALADGDHAGLLCTGNRFMGIGVSRQQGHTSIYIEQDGQTTMVAPCPKKVVYLRVDVDSQQNHHQLSYSTDGKHFVEAGEPFALRMGSWKGSRVGLYQYSTQASGQGGKAYFDYFKYDILR